MGLLQAKDYLDFFEVANYLTERGEYINSHDKHGVQKLKRIIYDLIRERKLKAVFYYDGLASFVHLEITQDGGVDTINTLEFDVQGYFIFDNRCIKDMIFTEAGENIKGNYCPHLLFDEKFYPELACRKSEELEYKRGDKWWDIELETDERLYFYDLRFPKSDLDKLFNQHPQTDSQLSQQVADQQATIDRQAKEITQLKAQIVELKQQAGKVSDTPADDDIVTNAKRLTTIENVIFALVELTGKDNSSPYSQNKNSLNGEITQILDNAKLTNNYQSTGFWLDIAKRKKK